MAETSAVLVGEMIGWRPTDDGAHMLCGFKDHKGREFELALTPGMLRHVIAGLIQASGFFDKAMVIGSEQQIETFPVSWFNVAKADDEAGFALQFQLTSGDQLAFFIDPQITKRLAETLEAVAGDASIPPVPEKLKN